MLTSVVDFGGTSYGGGRLRLGAGLAASQNVDGDTVLTALAGPLSLLQFGSSLSAALTSIADTPEALLLNANAPVSVDTTIPATLATIGQAGALLTVASGKTLTIDGSFTAGAHQVFAGTGTVLFGSGAVDQVYPEWFPGADYAAQISAAIASIRAIGGVVALTRSATLTSSVNATNCTRGLVIRGRGAPMDGGSSGRLRLVFAHTGIGFDFTATHDLTLENFTIGTDPTTYPEVGLYFARNEAESGAGEVFMSNVRTDWGSKFSVACVYNYGAEVITQVGCYFGNAVAGKPVYYVTSYNNLLNSSATPPGILSPYVVPMATGVQSTTVFNFYGCTLFHTTGGILFYLDCCADFHVHGGIWINSGGSANVYIDGTNATTDNFSVTAVRGEPGSPSPDYFIHYYRPTSSQTSATWNIRANRIWATTRAILADGFAAINGLTYQGNNDSTAVGCKFFGLDYSNLDLRAAYLEFDATGFCTNTRIRNQAALNNFNGCTTSGVRIEDILTGSAYTLGADRLSPWTDLSLLNGWVNVGGVSPNAGFRVDYATGLVSFRGLIKNGTPDVSILQMPGGASPSKPMQFILSAFDNVAGVRTFAFCYVEEDLFPSASHMNIFGVGGSGSTVDLAGVTYFTA